MCSTEHPLITEENSTAILFPEPVVPTPSAFIVWVGQIHSSSDQIVVAVRVVFIASTPTPTLIIIIFYPPLKYFSG